MEKFKLPTPVFGRVIIKNPLFNLVEEHRDAMNKLPNEEAKQKYAKENIFNIFDCVELVASASDCFLKLSAGSKVMVGPEVAQSADQLNEGEFFMFRESAIKAIW